MTATPEGALHVKTAPLVMVTYEDDRFHVAYGLRPEGHEHGEAGADEVVGGIAIALGILLSRIATIDPDYLDSGIKKTKESFWSQVRDTIDEALKSEAK